VGLAGGGAWLGSVIQKSARTSRLSMVSDSAMKLAYFKALPKRDVLTDGYIAEGSLDQFAKNSGMVRRAFLDKHLRISFGASIGPNTIRGNLEKMLASNTLPSITEYRKGPLAIEFCDLSWRF
jgi:hypothetical protein